ncbi:MAG: ATP-binding protein [Dysgonamonadaceae bacterium]|jgi:predicted AAA+ superfamily ATPase|nr:ATP-binding protein [Dysgonamonadaceae bacterium]
MEATLLRLNKHWEGQKYPSLYKRDLIGNLKKKKDLPHIQVLTGIRRSGKSTIFRLMINDLMDEGKNPKEILLLNLDEPFFTSLWANAAGLYQVVEAAEKLTSVKIKYLFLDEIQQVKNWELFAKGAYDTQHFNKIYITGSNSDLLQNHFATLLSGRYFTNTIRPFSLKEWMLLHDFPDRYSTVNRRPELLQLLDSYMKYGSFPEIVLNPPSDDIKTELLKNYYDSIVLKDCIVYNQIRDSSLFYRLLHFLLSNAGAPFYYTSLAKAVSSNENTTRNYLEYAHRSYVISDITNFSFSLKEETRSQHKVYSIDTGLMNAVGFQFIQRGGMLLENIVYNELVNNGYGEIAFVRSTGGECDFIAKKEGQFHAFQVCHELTPLNQAREINGFNVFGKLPIASKTILTYNQEETIDDIRVIPFWQFFGFVPSPDT